MKKLCLVFALLGLVACSAPQITPDTERDGGIGGTGLALQQEPS